MKTVFPKYILYNINSYMWEKNVLQSNKFGVHWVMQNLKVLLISEVIMALIILVVTKPLFL